ncbi:class I SAM-dependent methyltransferase [Taklimakanibacter deserti]|uniref:class I SAM-dependent methyltransferase n=1 Tax=Taklimakanibacter deserti TaxID=2267839 RepID=UPI000E6541E0
MPKDRPSSDDKTTLRFYAEKAEIYVASGRGVSPHLHGFLKKLTPGARILELGCGSGRDAEAMIKAGFDVEPTDGTPEIAREAEERLSRKVRVMRFDELDASEEYDAVWAAASLLHVPRPALPRVLGLIYKALKPGGLHFASYKAGGVEGRDDHGRYFNYLARAEVLELYRTAAPWEVEEVFDTVADGYLGKRSPWVAITVRKADRR